MRRLILVSLLLTVAVASTACLNRLFPADSLEPEQTQAAQTATPQSAVEAQPTNTPQPTPTVPPEPTSEPATDASDEEAADEMSTDETPADETSADEASADEAVADQVSSSEGTPDIVDVIWQWIEMQDASGTSPIADPENYVLVFYADNSFNVRADCNTGHGTYALEGDRLTLGPIALTKMMCPKGSRSNQYVELLSEAYTVAIDPENGNLVITLEDDAGKMVFANAGKPKVPPDCEPKCPAVADIVGVVWQWVEIEEPDGTSEVPDPENYVLTLHPDGTFNIKADCNVGNGTYTLEGNHLTLNVTAITEAYCGDDSLFDLFISMLDAVNTVTVEQGRLVLTLADGAGKMFFCPAGKAKVPPNPCDWIVDVLWMWERFDDQAGQNDIVVDEPSKYTLQLLPDGTFRFKADCNSGSGTYICCCGSRLTLNVGITTLAECGPDSLHDEYLDRLGDVVSFVMDEGKLILNLKADAGNMVFGRGNEPANGLGIDLDTVTLDTTGLPHSWQANLVPATPYDASQPPGPVGLPEHIEISFGEAAGEPVLYIIPVNAYKQLWEAEGEPGVSVIVEALQSMLWDPPETFPTAGVPVLPFEELGGTNDLAVQGQFVSLETVIGLRFVGRFAQSPTLVTNEGLRYIFQGFAGNEDEYMVAFFYPVSTEALPDSAEDAPAAELARLQDDPGAYLEEKATMLNELSEEEWNPDLSLLDAVIASLRF